MWKFGLIEKPPSNFEINFQENFELENTQKSQIFTFSV